MNTFAGEGRSPDPDRLRDLLRTVIDPEAGINIVDLGLVYDVSAAGGHVQVTMTMTSPACPMGSLLQDEVRATLAAALPPGTPVEVELTFEPPWEPSMMSAQARQHFQW